MKALLTYLFLALLIAPPADAASEPEDATGAISVAEAVRFSETVSSTTGMAISPLLGVGVLGAWQYTHAEPEVRSQLPWYTHPWVWGFCLCLFLLANSKDTIGVMAPEVLKKPFVVADVLEDKVSALVIVFAVVPAYLNSRLPEAPPLIVDGTVSAGSPLLAVIGLNLSPWLLLTPLVILIFAVVWVVSHAVQCLLVLSPSSLISFSVRLTKYGFLGIFAAVAYLSPWLGLILSVGIFLFCLFFFGWAFRWNVFGTLFMWDYLTLRHRKPLTPGQPVNGFSTRHIEGPKPRTYGEWSRAGNLLIFTYRPWLVFARRELYLPLDHTSLAIRKGLLLPSLSGLDTETHRRKTLAEFRPRYRKHEQELSEEFDAREILPSHLIHGIQNSWRWLREQSQRRSEAGRLTGHTETPALPE